MTAFPREKLPPFRPKLVPHGMMLRFPATQPEGTTGVTAYEMACCLQLDDTHCLLLAGIDEQGGGDLCVGNDAFVFEKLSEIKAEKAIVVNRGAHNFTQRDGRGPAYLAKFPGLGGFVPLGAKLEDGSPHPGAGTGFFLSSCVPYTPDKTSALENPESCVESIQIKWDGKKVTFHRPQYRYDLMGLPLNCDIGLTPCCPQGEDLLQPIGISGQGVIVFRFEYNGESWEAVAHGEPFSMNKGGAEATLPGEPFAHRPGETEASLRRVGSHYYLYTRGTDPYGRLYESEDGLNFRFIRAKENVTVPQVLNEGLDGSLYVATNPGPGWLRNPLVAYDISNADDEGIILHDQDGIRDDKGEKIPFVDHAISYNIRLEGRDRHFIFYRVCDLKERTFHKFQIDAGFNKLVHGEKGPSARRSTTGLYLLELEF